MKEFDIYLYVCMYNTIKHIYIYIPVAAYRSLPFQTIPVPARLTKQHGTVI